MDVVDKAFRELEKSIQKATIKSKGFSAVERNLSNTTKIKDQCKMKITPVVSNLSASTRALKVTVKGRFGQKLTYVLKKERELLERF